MAFRLVSLILSLSLFCQQAGIAYASGELNLANYLSSMRNTVVQPDVFQPARLRYISYDIASNEFKLLLDKGETLKGLSPKWTVPEKEELFNYFLIGLALPNDTFWVNLRPDAPENIIDPLLEKTDIGKIFLEADLQLKKDTASLTSPQNHEGKQYWDKLYKKAEELFPAVGGSAFGGENITIPTITRPWIVPNEVIVRETEDSAYIYKATLKVMLEDDYLRGMKDDPAATGASGRGTIDYSFNDPRLKELNEYSTRLIRETIIPKLTKEVNSSKRYAKLRQVYYSLVLSRWFKQKYQGQPVGNGLKPFPALDSGDLTNLTSQEPYDKQTYFQAYQKSFKDGEYNLKETVASPSGQSIRNYISGGLFITSSPMGGVRTTKENPYLKSLILGSQDTVVSSAVNAKDPTDEVLITPEGIINEINEIFKMFLVSINKSDHLLSEDQKEKVVEVINNLKGELNELAKVERSIGKFMNVLYEVIQSLDLFDKDRISVWEMPNNKFYYMFMQLRASLFKLYKEKAPGSVGKKGELAIQYSGGSGSWDGKIPIAGLTVGGLISRAKNEMKVFFSSLLEDWLIPRGLNIDPKQMITDAFAELDKAKSIPETLEEIKTLIDKLKNIKESYIESLDLDPDSSEKKQLSLNYTFMVLSLRILSNQAGWGALDANKSDLPGGLTASPLTLFQQVILNAATMVLSKGYVDKEILNVSKDKSPTLQHYINKNKSGDRDGLEILMELATKENSNISRETARDLTDVWRSYFIEVVKKIADLPTKTVYEIVYAANREPQGYYNSREAYVDMATKKIIQELTDGKDSISSIELFKLNEAWMASIDDRNDFKAFGSPIEVPHKTGELPFWDGDETKIEWQAKATILKYVPGDKLEDKQLKGIISGLKEYISANKSSLWESKMYPLDNLIKIIESGDEGLLSNLRFALSKDDSFQGCVEILNRKDEKGNLSPEVNFVVGMNQWIEIAITVAGIQELADNMQGNDYPVVLNNFWENNPHVIFRLDQFSGHGLSRDSYNGKVTLPKEKVGIILNEFYRDMQEEIKDKEYLLSLMKQTSGSPLTGHILSYEEQSKIVEVKKGLSILTVEVAHLLNAYPGLLKEDYRGVLNKIKEYGRQNDILSLAGIMKEFYSAVSRQDAKENYGNKIADKIKEWAEVQDIVKKAIERINKSIDEDMELEHNQLTEVPPGYGGDRKDYCDDVKMLLEKKDFAGVASWMIHWWRWQSNNDKVNKWREISGKLKIINMRSGLPHYFSGSPLIRKGQETGGIDLTDRFMRLKIERTGGFADIKLSLPQVRNAQNIDLDREFKQIEAMASSGIVPNSRRILELFSACYSRGEFNRRLPQVIFALKSSSAIQENLAIDSDDDFRLCLLLPEIFSDGG